MNVLAPLERGVLEWDLSQIASSLRLTEEETKAYFTDGRRVSFVIERRLTKEVIKGVLAHSEGASYDLIDPTGGKWEVRSISRGGIYFCPSYMVGSGRKFDEAGFLAKLSAVEGYIVSDITTFPKVPYWVLPVELVAAWWEAGSLGLATKISRRTALRLLGDAAGGP